VAHALTPLTVILSEVEGPAFFLFLLVILLYLACHPERAQRGEGPAVAFRALYQGTVSTVPHMQQNI
jgi:hypothetical protein